MHIHDSTPLFHCIRPIAGQGGGMDTDAARWLERSRLSEAQLGDASLNVLFPHVPQCGVDVPSSPGSPLWGVVDLPRFSGQSSAWCSSGLHRVGTYQAIR